MFYPMFALVVLTYVVLLINWIWRFQAVRGRRVSIKYFRTFDGAEAPSHIKAGTRHFANLFELPVLFYVACLVALVVEIDSPLLLGCAWLFVFFRLVHALVHMSYNNVIHRMVIFWGGALTVLVMWSVLLVHHLHHVR